MAEFKAGCLVVAGKEYEVIGSEHPSGKQSFTCTYLDNLETRLQAIEGLVNTNVADERDYLLKNATSAKYIASRYNKTNGDKNGFSTIQVATVIFRIDVALLQKENGKWKNEIEIAEEIYSTIEALRQAI